MMLVKTQDNALMYTYINLAKVMRFLPSFKTLHGTSILCACVQAQRAFMELEQVLFYLEVRPWFRSSLGCREFIPFLCPQFGLTKC